MKKGLAEAWSWVCCLIIALTLHLEKLTCIENKLPAYTVGSLQRKSQMDVLLEFIKAMLKQHNPADKLKELVELIDESF